MAAGSGSDADVVVRFGASINEVQDKVNELLGIFNGVGAKLAAVAGIVAGGAAFGKFANDAKEMNLEAMRFSRTLGMTGEEVGTLNQALSDIGADMGTYSGAFMRFNRNLKANADEMRRMGVDVDAFNKGTKTGNQLFMESLQILAKYKPGMDQTQAAMRIFGSRVGDINLLMRLNAEGLEAARKRNEELNLTISEEGVAAAEEYRAALDDVGDVQEGFTKTIGETLMPMLTKMMQGFSDMGATLITGTRYAMESFKRGWETIATTVSRTWESIKSVLSTIVSGVMKAFGRDSESISAMEVFKNSLRIVEAVLIALGTTVQVVAVTVETGVKQMATSFKWVADIFATLWGVIRGEKGWADVKLAWQKGLDELGNLGADWKDRVKSIYGEGRAAVDEALTGSREPAEVTPKGYEGKGTQSAPKDPREALAAMQAMSQLNKAVRDSELAVLKEQDARELAQLNDLYKQKITSTVDYYARKERIERSALDREISARQQELADIAAMPAMNEAGEIAKRAQLAAVEGQINTLIEKRKSLTVDNTLAMEAELRALEKQRAEREAQFMTKVGMSDIEQARADANQRLALGQITADELESIERDLERRKYEISLTETRKRLEVAGADQDARTAILNEQEMLYREHQARLTDIARQGEMRRKQLQLQASGDIRQSMTESVRSWINGVGSLGNAMFQFATRVRRIFEDLIAQRLVERLFGQGTMGGKLMDKMVELVDVALNKIISLFFSAEAQKTAAAAAGATERVAIEGAAEAQSSALTFGGAVKRIGMAAWEAAASVYKSIAAIPFVGPFLAPAMAVGAATAVMGFIGRMSSAEGGWWQVPADRITNIHKDEMVLPAQEAQGLRQLISSGGGMQGDTHLHVHAIDANSVERFFRRSGNQLVDALRRQHRNFAF